MYKLTSVDNTDSEKMFSKPWCLPIFLRCNGVDDCYFGEDERDCKLYHCPGLYQCTQSKVCLVHSWLCDGHPHCPLHDDELYCDNICPSHKCLCRG